MSKDSPGFSRDTRGRSAIYLSPGVIFGLEGIQYLKCGCKPQNLIDSSVSSTNCANCQCVKRKIPCSIFCCCKGQCKNSIDPNYLNTKSLFRQPRFVAMDTDEAVQEDEDGGQDADDNSLTQTDDEENNGDFGGDHDDDEL